MIRKHLSKPPSIEAAPEINLANRGANAAYWAAMTGTFLA